MVGFSGGKFEINENKNIKKRFLMLFRVKFVLGRGMFVNDVMKISGLMEE
jgi:hypothetical protein